MNILGLDPGHQRTAMVVWNGERILMAQYLPHAEMREYLRFNEPILDVVCCEQMSCYGMPVGREVFETVLEIGRYLQVCADNDLRVILPTRSQIAMHLCRQNRGDAQMRASLIERFGAPGTKKAPGVTHGLSKDLWQAFGVAVFGYDHATTLQTLTP